MRLFWHFSNTVAYGGIGGELKLETVTWVSQRCNGFLRFSEFEDPAWEFFFHERGGKMSENQCFFKSHCFKMTQNVELEFFNFGIFHQFLFYWNLTCLVSLFDNNHKLVKTRQNRPILAFFINFIPLKI